MSRVALIPELRLGVAVLTNQESGYAFNSVAYRVLDHYLGAKAPDYVGAYRQAGEMRRSKTAKLVSDAAAARDSASGPSLPLQQYAGRYRDEWYGNVTIAMEGRGLVLRMGATPGMVGDLGHWQHDTFVARWRDRELRADAYVTFGLRPDGAIDQMKMAPTSPEVDFSFDFQDLLLRPVRTSLGP